MAIPVYSGPQVSPDLSQAARLSPGSATNPLGVLGAGVQQAAGDALKILDDADRLKAEAELNKAQIEGNALYLRFEGIKGLNVMDPERYGGDQGKTLSENAMTEYEKTLAKLRETLSPNQRKYFDAGAERIRMGLEHQIGQHEAKQIDAFTLEHFKNTDAIEADTLAKRGVVDGLPDGPMIQQIMERRKYNAKEFARLYGQESALALGNIEAETHKTILSILADKNPEIAAAYFSDHKGSLDEKTRLVFDKLITERKNIITAQRLVPIIARDYTVPGMGYFNLAGATEAAIYKYAPDNPELQKQLVSALESRYRVMKESVEYESKPLANELYKIFDSTGDAVQMHNSKAYDKLMNINSEAAVKILQWAESRQKERERITKGEDAETRDIQERLNFISTMADKNALQHMDMNQFADKIKQLGSHWKPVHEQWQWLRSSERIDKLRSVNLPKDTIDGYAFRLGIKPKSDDYNAFKVVLESKIGEAQVKKGEPLSVPEMDELAKRLGDKVITMEPGWIWRDALNIVLPESIEVSPVSKKEMPAYKAIFSGATQAPAAPNKKADSPAPIKKENTKKDEKAKQIGTSTQRYIASKILEKNGEIKKSSPNEPRSAQDEAKINSFTQYLISSAK